MTGRLLIVEDDPEITSALKRGLALHGYVALSESRADRALERLVSNPPFAGAIIDVMLGRDSGIDVVRAARKSGARLPILMISALSEVEQRAAGLAAGADDYIVKPFHFDELVARMRVQEQMAVSRDPPPATLHRVTRELRAQALTAHLTEREFDLLALLSRTGAVPQPRGEIFDALWSGEGRSSENVVDVYIGYLRRKLEAGDFGFEIRTVRNRGFCIIGAAPVLDET